MPLVYVLLLTFVLGLGGTIIQKAIVFTKELQLPESQYGLLGSLFTPGTMLFGGDIMLGRSVENVMIENGPSYPFLKIADLVRTHDIAVANFEASVPLVHVKTLPNTMRFSVTKDAVTEIQKTGFDVLSLANNHTLDHGDEGFTHTRAVCHELQLLCVGHSVRIQNDSIATVRVGQTQIGLLMIHTLFESPSTTTLRALIDTLESTTDLQYAFVHWGDEYEREHNPTQEELAYFLIDEGIDGVIGHHPHVMQDIEIYRDKPIFYSLGNLIFDQYFSKDVQEGYVVSVAFDKKGVTYTLIPYDSHDVRSQPQLQAGEGRATTLRTLMNPSVFTSDEIESGSFKLSRE